MPNTDGGAFRLPVVSTTDHGEVAVEVVCPACDARTLACLEPESAVDLAAGLLTAVIAVADEAEPLYAPNAILEALAAGPVRIEELAVKVARQTGCGFEPTCADIWAMIQDGVLDYSASAFVSIAQSPGRQPDAQPTVQPDGLGDGLAPRSSSASMCVLPAM